MPNWCTTEYTFYGNSNDITAFHDKLIEWTSKNYHENGFGIDWLGNILIGAGFDYQLNEEGKLENWGRIRCRGALTYIDDVYAIDDNTSEFDITTETAWGAMPILWFAIIHKYNWNIKFNFLEIEPGMGIYCMFNMDEIENNPEQYYVECLLPVNKEIKNEKIKELFTVLEQGIFLKEELKHALGKVLGEKDINELINEVNDLIKDTDAIININKIENITLENIIENKELLNLIKSYNKNKGEIKEMNKFEVVKDAKHDVILPKRSTSKSAGYDFIAPYDVTIMPGKIAKIKTDVKVMLDSDKVLLIYPRSSLGIKFDISIANTVGVIDSDYYGNPDNDGNIIIALKNNNTEAAYEVHKGDKIAQGIITKFYITEDDNATGERLGGVGSTGN